MTTMKKNRREACVSRNVCAACGACANVCPREAVTIWKGCFAVVNTDKCVGCGKCVKICPTNCISIKIGGADDEN